MTSRIRGMRGVESVTAKQKLLTLRLENKVYLPGDEVRGEVSLNVVLPIKISALRIRLCCKEWGDMIRPAEVGAGELVAKQRMPIYKQLITCEGCTKKLSHAYADATRNGGASVITALPSCTVLPGQYCYPFQFKLPYWLPPTYHVKGDDQDFAAIVCFVKAYIDDPGTKGDADIIVRQFFRVLGVMPRSQYQTILASRPQCIEAEHKYFRCCFARSVKTRTCVLGVSRLDKDAFMIARVEVYDPHGGVERVKVSLHHVLNVDAKGHKETRRAELSVVEATLVADPIANPVNPFDTARDPSAGGPANDGSPLSAGGGAAPEVDFMESSRSVNPFSGSSSGSTIRQFVDPFPPIRPEYAVYIAKIPLSRDMTPSINGLINTSSYEVVTELDIPYAEDPATTLTPIMAHMISNQSAFKPLLYIDDGIPDATIGSWDVFSSTNEVLYEVPPNPLAPARRIRTEGGSDAEATEGHVVSVSVGLGVMANDVLPMVYEDVAAASMMSGAGGIEALFATSVRSAQRTTDKGLVKGWRQTDPTKKY